MSFLIVFIPVSFLPCIRYFSGMVERILRWIRLEMTLFLTLFLVKLSMVCAIDSTDSSIRHSANSSEITSSSPTFIFVWVVGRGFFSRSLLVTHTILFETWDQNSSVPCDIPQAYYDLRKVLALKLEVTRSNTLQDSVICLSFEYFDCISELISLPTPSLIIRLFSIYIISWG